MDSLDKLARSKRMSLIGSKDTKPELLVRSFMYKAGFRYRLHNKKLPGKPDLSLAKYKAAIFVHGCFWHGHDCHIGHLPKSNTPFWENKINTNSTRDAKRIRTLNEMGWRVLTIWECALLGKTKLSKEMLLEQIKTFLENPEETSAYIT